MADIFEQNPRTVHESFDSNSRSVLARVQPQLTSLYLEMKFIAAAIATLAVTAQASVVFMASTEANNQGIRQSWVTDRWVCK